MPRCDRADTLIRADDALARPVRMVGPGEHGGAIYDVVTAILTDLSYRHGVERVAPSALSDGLEAWVGRPVVFQGAEHDAGAIERDPTIQGRKAVGTVISARYDAAAGERIMQVAVPDAADCARIDSGEYAAASEAYDPTLRDPTPDERAAGVSAVQIARRPLSLALVDRGRAGPRARVRTDLQENDMIRTDAEDPKPGSLDALMAFLAAYKDNAEAKMLVKGWLGGESAEPAEPVMDADPAVPMVPKSEADAQKMRADAAEAELKTLRAAKLRTDAAEIAADIRRAGIAVDGFDPANPTAESVTKAREAVVAAALSRLRTDSIDPSAPQGGRPDPRPSKGDSKPTTVHASRFGGAPAAQE